MNKINKRTENINWDIPSKEEFPLSTASHAFHTDWQNTKIDCICGGTHCKLANSCALHCKPEGTYTYVDYSTMGSGGTNCEDTWYCGDNTKNYPNYQIKRSGSPEVAYPAPCRVGDRVNDWIVSEICTRRYLDDDRKICHDATIELMDIGNTSNIYVTRTYTINEFIEEFGFIK